MIRYNWILNKVESTVSIISENDLIEFMYTLYD